MLTCPHTDMHTHHIITHPDAMAVLTFPRLQVGARCEGDPANGSRGATHRFVPVSSFLAVDHWRKRSTLEETDQPTYSVRIQVSWENFH
jgi:hypothetical protein